MPVGRFVEATLVCIDNKSKTGEIWIGGTPECMLIGPDGRVTQRFAPQQLPLGIIDTNDELLETVHFKWEKTNQLAIFSDGLIEAANREGVQFDNQGLLLAMGTAALGQRHQAVRHALQLHLDGLTAHDDVSLLLIECPENS